MKERSCSILNSDKYNIIFIANKTLAGKAIQYNTIRQNSVWTMHGGVNRPAHT